MKCLIIWTVVLLLAMCVSAEDTSMDVHPGEELESVGVETFLAAKPKTTVRTTKWIFIIYLL